MPLLELLKSKSVEEQKALAAACDTSAQYLFHVAHERKRAGETLCINLERETGGVIRCEDLRPDVDWAYLRNTKPKKRRAA